MREFSIPRDTRTRKGRYEVTQLVHNGSLDEMRTDFDAEHFTVFWSQVMIGRDVKTAVLRVEEINLPPQASSFSFQEFSLPVNFKFVPED